MEILGVRVDEYTMQETEELVAAQLAAPVPPCLHQVVTINPIGVMLAVERPALKEIVAQAAAVTADGSGILWAAQRLGRPLREQVAGYHLLCRLCERGASAGWRVYLLGSRPGIADAAARELQSRYPGLQICGTENGYFRDREAAVIEAVRAAQPDLLFAALGMPYQEEWLYQHRAELGCKVAVGVGGSLDVLAGAVKHAPDWVCRIHLEWLWRLLGDPKRLRADLAIPRFMRAVRREARRRRSGREQA